MSKSNIIQLWKEKNIDRVVLTFSAGGDSMGDMEWEVFGKDNQVVDETELTDYFENEVFREVEFYEVSDGQYMGEFGTVTITFEEDEDDEDGGIFVYDKEAQSEYEETFSSVMEVELSDEEVKLLTDKIENINGSEWDNEPNINYKDDCVLTDEEETLLNDLVSKIKDMSSDFEVEGQGEEVDSDRNFDTGDSGDGLDIDGNVLQVNVSARFYFTQDSED